METIPIEENIAEVFEEVATPMLPTSQIENELARVQEEPPNDVKEEKKSSHKPVKVKNISAQKEDSNSSSESSDLSDSDQLNETDSRISKPKAPKRQSKAEFADKNKDSPNKYNRWFISDSTEEPIIKCENVDDYDYQNKSIQDEPIRINKSSADNSEIISDEEDTKTVDLISEEFIITNLNSTPKVGSEHKRPKDRKSKKSKTKDSANQAETNDTIDLPMTSTTKPKKEYKMTKRSKKEPKKTEESLANISGIYHLLDIT